MHHSFNVEFATKYGMLEAVLFENICFWVARNRANGVHFHDGCYWTYNSARAFSELFPYASERSISRALHHLSDEGIIITGNYNENRYDRTTWYTLTEKGFSIGQSETIDSPFCQIDTSDLENRSVENGRPIPYSNTDIEPINVSTDSKESVCRTDVQRIVEAWNDLQKFGIAPVSKMSSTSKRYKSLVARIREHGVDGVLKAIKQVENSDFLLGKNNRGWTITFDWFVLPNNFPKVLERNYTNRAAPVDSCENERMNNLYGNQSFKL